MTPAEAKARLLAVLDASKPKPRKPGVMEAMSAIFEKKWEHDAKPPEERAVIEAQWRAEKQARIDANNGLIPRDGHDCEDWFLAIFYRGCEYVGIEPIKPNAGDAGRMRDSDE